MGTARKCPQCGATISIYNDGEICQNHNNPRDLDPIGDRMREIDRALKYLGNPYALCPVTRLKGDLKKSPVSFCMISYENVPYHLDIKL